jgi:hypothetical protein
LATFGMPSRQLVVSGDVQHQLIERRPIPVVVTKRGQLQSLVRARFHSTFPPDVSDEADDP